MKTKIATALSLIGVLSAGSAAALVNTQILDSGPTKSGQSAAVPEQVASTTIPVGAAPSSTATSTLPTTTAPTMIVVTKPSTVASPAPTGFLTTYNVGDAGSVTLDVIDGMLTIVSSAPNAGWQVSKSEQNDDENRVAVDFQSATVRVEFEATFVDGQIVPEVSSSPVVDGTIPPNTIDDDDEAVDDDEADDGDDHGGDDHSGDAGDDAGEQDDD